MVKLDIRTKLFLFALGANIVQRDDDLHETRKCDVYVFDDYNDYVNYFKGYFGSCLDEELINKAIFTTSKNGQVIALKGLCEHIIASLCD